jgi:uncharacterized protein YabE (DUF348 family)
MKLIDQIKKPLIQRIIAGLTAILGACLIILSLNKTIYLVVNGDLQKYETYALTVRGFLKSQDLLPDENDRLMPDIGSLLWGNETIFLNYSSQVQIEADGEVIELKTAEPNPFNVLLEAGLPALLSAGDFSEWHTFDC